MVVCPSLVGGVEPLGWFGNLVVWIGDLVVWIGDWWYGFGFELNYPFVALLLTRTWGRDTF